jgi:hypothetical protein
MGRELNYCLAFLAGGLLIACGSSGDLENGGSHVNGAGGGAAAMGNDGAAASAAADGGGTGGFGTNRNAGGTAGRGGRSGTGATAGVGGASGSAGTAGRGGTSGSTGGPITGVTPVPAGQGCADETLQASGKVLDIFIMQDRSGSMSDNTSNGQSKWTVVTSAINAFVADPQSAGIGAGIGFFGDDGSDNPSCDAATYATPAVGIAPLNGNAQPITNAIGNLNPAGRTPTDPALQGALSYARSWAQRNPTHKVIVVLATDGAPNDNCGSSPQAAAAVAASGVSGTPSIQTYVIGVIGQGTGDGNCQNGPTQNCQFVQTLNGIAKSGGTGTAFIVNTTQNTQQQFQDAMNAIRNANGVGCIFSIPAPPSGKTVDLTKATVQYTPGTGAPQSLPWATGVSACKGSWYYDSVTTPTDIHICPGICASINTDPKARVDVIVACKPPATGGGGAPGGGGTPGGGGSPNGGASGAAGRPGAGGVACLLDGQSCLTGADCCGGSCNGGVCLTLH